MSNVVDMARRAERDTRSLDERLVISTKLCVRCRADKPKEGFRAFPKNRDGLHSYCNPCNQEISKKYQQKKREQGDWVDRVLLNVRASAGSKSRRRKTLAWAVPDLTREFLLDLFRYQDGKCVYFNIPMLTECSGMNLQAITVERINCDKGYVQGNVVLACRAANLARSNASVDDMFVLVEMIKRS